MANPRAFLSFDFDHNETSKTLFAGQAAKDSPTPFVLEDWSSKRSLPEAEWEKLLAGKIANCHMMIVLVGKSMGSAKGVVAEMVIAKDKNVPFFGVYVDGAGTDSTLPTGLARNRTISWTWPGVGKAIDQMMGEGKNA
jgi:hypothetical protein